MLSKITRGNQVTIPKEIVAQAHLKDSSSYVDVSYVHGIICLKPVVLEERIDPEQYEKFEAWAKREEKGDFSCASLKSGVKRLKAGS